MSTKFDLHTDFGLLFLLG